MSHGSAHWRQRPEGGGRFALWLIRSIALYGGRPLSRLFLYPITLYFFLRRGPERQASRAFLSRIAGHAPTILQMMRHMHCFASTVLDRVFLLSRGPRDFEIDVEGLDMLDACIDRGRGVLLLGSHHGSFEALRTLSARRPEVPLRVVLNKQQTPAMTELLEALAPDIAERVIDGSRDPASVVLALSEAVGQGQMIALLADRGRPDESMCRVPFLGDPAPFPTGPWILAAALKVPVVLCFGIYEGGNRYKMRFEAFTDRVELPRGAREAALQKLVAAYAERLQHHVRLAPYNWFNFYDFWYDHRHAADAGLDAGDALHDGVRV